MRIRKKKWTLTEMETNAFIVEEPEKNKNNWHNVFLNDNPIQLEIGCGKGQFICETARRNSNINFIALERVKTILAMASRKARNMELTNIYFVHSDVADLLNIFDSGELERIYINFCDPWHGRKKWAKRRLTHRSFLDMYCKLLNEQNGDIFFKTDNEELFDFSIIEFTESKWQLSNVTRDLHSESYSKDMIRTEYEEKFIGRGQPIFRLEAHLPNN